MSPYCHIAGVKRAIGQGDSDTNHRSLFLCTSDRMFRLLLENPEEVKGIRFSDSSSFAFILIRCPLDAFIGIFRVLDTHFMHMTLAKCLSSSAVASTKHGIHRIGQCGEFFA